MNQDIFDLGLSVEGTSLFLMMEHLSDVGAVLDRETMLPIWNASAEAFDKALAELESRGVIERGAPGRWYLCPAADWR